ncbi:MAG: HlyD family efflux transporter periplasmic adaptor subunit [Ruminococcaceae bacterium]|nr:HlyD family efflux transporter periplasmic adaptor subunit [Oscillospiraceae bacterium]
MIKKAAAIVLSLGMISGMFTGCKQNEATTQEIKLPIYGAEEITYEVATAQYMDISQTQSYGATIGYPFADNLYYPADAQVVSFSAIKGKDVVEGQVLAELDSGDLDYEISNQQTIVNTALSQAHTSEAARLQYEIEQYTLDMLLAEKEKYIIRAPYDGIIVGIQRVTAGDQIEAGAVCCTVAPADGVQVYIDGKDANNFRYGQSVVVKIDGVEYPAKVVMAPDVAPATADNYASRRAVFLLDNDAMDKLIVENQMALAAGWATVYLTTEKKNVLAVPDAAVKTTGMTSSVTLLDGTERFRFNVTVGMSLGGYTEIVDGIAEGDVVISDGSGTFVSSNDNADNDDDHGGWNGEWDGERHERD